MRAVAEIQGIDLRALRTGRLERLQAAMRDRSVEVCLLFNEPNVRYATGASAMPVWSMSTFVRCALVPAEGTPILFEHPNSIHRSRLAAADVRPMRSWEFIDRANEEAAGWAAETISAMHELGLRGDRVALDRLGTPGLLALERAGVSIIDAAPATRTAREVKTPEEIALFDLNGAIVMRMLAAFEAAIAPGVRERDLVATLSETLLRNGGEYLATNTVASGPNTNPWRAEATARALESGDLVYVDTDTVGVEGYFLCVSRTFHCGDGDPGPQQRDIHAAALEWLTGMREVIRPGMSCTEISERAPTLPERFFPQRYEVMVHGLGLEEEGPSVAYPGDPQPNPDRVIEPGMVLCVELYAGEVGARDGVKLGDVVVTTDDGLRVVAPYPFAASVG
jgi:Xaa-Pro aminopeptidase